MPKTTTGEMKDALGRLRDYLNDLLGEDSSDKEGARQALGIDLAAFMDRIEAKADQEDMELALETKADKSELDTKTGILAEEMATRMDAALTNVTASGKSIISKLGMPSARTVLFTVGESEKTYTAPANGYFCYTLSGNGTNPVSVNLYSTTTSIGIMQQAVGASSAIKGYIPVTAGDRVVLQYWNLGTEWRSFYFIYAEGEQA